MTATYQPAREEIVRAARRLMDRGYLAATGGNLSVRIPGADAFAVTPSNYDYLKMLPEDICILSLDLDAMNGERTPSVESALHAAVYRARPDTHAVVHTHQVNASALAIMGTALPALFDEQVRYLGRRVPVVPYRPSGTSFLRNALTRRLGDHSNAYLLKSHGALCLGADMERAVHNVELLEKCAAAYLLALCTGRRVWRIPLPIREIAFSRLRADQKRGESA
jgi:L-ribulose-5-phosphate 4-epimerase